VPDLLLEQVGTAQELDVVGVPDREIAHGGSLGGNARAG
jgi:hypothetical protein